MTTHLLLAAAACAVLGAVWLFLRKAPRVLPVLRIDKTGRPFASSRDACAWMSPKRLEKLFSKLAKKQYKTVLPSDIVRGKLPPKPLLLLFRGGYQSFLDDALPLLEKYQFQAAVSLPVECIGQYDAWEKAPWQNLLTKAQITGLQKSGRVEFIADAPDGKPLPEDEEQIRWALEESKARLTRLYGLGVCGAYLPGKSSGLRLQTAEKHYSVVFTEQKGNNPLPLSRRVLRVFPAARFRTLSGLFRHMRRK